MHPHTKERGMSKRVNNKRGNRAKRKMSRGHSTKVRGKSHWPSQRATSRSVGMDYPLEGWLEMERHLNNALR